MKQPTPEELLQNKLDELIRARVKSVTAYNEGKLSLEEHETHMTNLNPLIEDYHYTIRVVNTYK